MWIKPGQSLANHAGRRGRAGVRGNLPVQRNTSRLLSALRAAGRHGAWWLASTPVLSPWPRPAFSTTAAPRPGRLPRPFASASGRTTIDRLFLESQGIASCAGGVATLDFILTLIERFHGRALAVEVADALVHTPRPGTSPQRRADQSRETTPAPSRPSPRSWNAISISRSRPPRRASASRCKLERHCRASMASRRCGPSQGQAPGGAQSSVLRGADGEGHCRAAALQLRLHPRLQGPVRRDPAWLSPGAASPARSDGKAGRRPPHPPRRHFAGA